MDYKKVDDSYLDDFSPIQVFVVNDRLEDAIHKFRTIVTKERIMSSLKEHYQYEKPSDKKRRQHREAIQRQKKLASTKPQKSKRMQKEEFNE